jgi:hypothetical protein
LKDHGVTSAKIKEGFRSPLSTESEYVPIPPSDRLAKEREPARFYMRVMTLDTGELAREAKEFRDDGFGNALNFALATDGMEAAVEKLYDAWPDSVSAITKEGCSALANAALCGIAVSLSILAIMGGDLSIRVTEGPNVFDFATLSPTSTPEMKAAVLKALSDHGVKSANIPPGFQSPLYFSSIYYQKNVRTQRWMNRKILMLCISRVYGWSLRNQIDDERYRTLPDDLSKLGCFICQCWFDVAGGDNKIDEDTPDNGIARLIMSYAFGFNDSKSPFALIGMPKYGKVPDTLTRCSLCIQPKKKGMLQCCTTTRYCSVTCQKAHRKSHKVVCERDAYLAKRAEVAARVASFRAEV